MASWQPVITLDGVDRSASVAGEVIVTAEESAARVASFTLRPPSGTVSAGDWLGVSVTIDYRTLDSAGNPISTERIFTGIVDRALYDPRTQTTAFECSDNLQEVVAALGQAGVEALIPAGRYSEAVFGDYEDGWEHLQNLLSTVPQAYDYSRTGVGQLTDWAAKTVADFSYTTAEIFDGTLAYSLAPRRDMVNRVAIEYGYRFRRLKHREHAFEWSFTHPVGSWDFCTYYQDSHEAPTREMIESAAASAGWQLQSVPIYRMFPPTGEYCGGGWSISDELRQSLVTAATWTAVKRWTQDATENYTLIIEAPQSQTWLGVIASDEFASRHTETDGEGWADGTATPTDTGMRIDSYGDYVIDNVDRTTSDNDIETLIARARCQILDAHRGNWLEGRVELEPTIECSHTVRLDGGPLAGKGKVIGITHEMEIDSGQASTLIRIAVFLNGGAVPIGDDTITAPAAPGTDPSGVPPEIITLLPTRLGNDDTVPPFDPSWTGFTGNYTVAHGTPAEDQRYERQFSVETTDIEQDAIDAVDGAASQTYQFDVPDEYLLINVP